MTDTTQRAFDRLILRVDTLIAARSMAAKLELAAMAERNRRSLGQMCRVVR